MIPRGHVMEARRPGRARTPGSTDADVARGWQWLLGHVRTYADLEAELSGRVEELIDFVTA